MSDTEETLPSFLENQVAMKNAVARAAHGLSLVEKRIVFAAISKLDSRRPQSDYLAPERRRLRVRADEYAELAGMDDLRSVYRLLREGCGRLFERYVRWVVLTPKGRKEVKKRWIEAVVYHDGEGWAEVTIATEILPHLVELKGSFTRYRLRQVEGLRSLYSWRLLEYLQSHSGGNGEQGKVTVALDEFMRALEVPARYRFADVRRRVIEPAVEELRMKDGWEIEWAPLKEGRKVKALQFRWRRSPQRDLLRES